MYYEQGGECNDLSACSIVLLAFFEYNMDIDMSECKGVILLPEKGNELEPQI